MKLNFYRDLEAGFGLIQSFLAEESGDYVKSFLSINLGEPDAGDKSAQVRRARVVAAYKAVLHRAGFQSDGKKVKFEGNKEINDGLCGGVDPSKGITYEQAADWFAAVWDAYDDDPYFDNYKKKRGKEWADEDLKAVLKMLTRKTKPGGAANVSGFTKLQAVQGLSLADERVVVRGGHCGETAQGRCGDHRLVAGRSESAADVLGADLPEGIHGCDGSIHCERGAELYPAVLRGSAQPVPEEG